MKNEEFKRAYHKARVGADMDEAISQHLPIEERDKLISSLENVQEWTGLDMRQTYFLAVLRGMKKGGAW